MYSWLGSFWLSNGKEYVLRTKISLGPYMRALGKALVRLLSMIFHPSSCTDGNLLDYCLCCVTTSVAHKWVWHPSELAAVPVSAHFSFRFQRFAVCNGKPFLPSLLNCSSASFTKYLSCFISEWFCEIFWKKSLLRTRRHSCMETNFLQIFRNFQGDCLPVFS